MKMPDIAIKAATDQAYNEKLGIPTVAVTSIVAAALPHIETALRAQIKAEIVAAGEKELKWIKEKSQGSYDAALLTGARDAWKEAANIAD